jgi:hypothetical protein
MKQGNKLYSLIPLDEFKAVLGVDDREDKLARFCLASSTFAIEQYCKRRLLRKKHFERIEFHGDLVFPLGEYPVVKMLSAFSTNNRALIDPELYCVIPDCGSDLDVPFSLSFSPVLRRWRGLTAINVVYWAGYLQGKAPVDLASACLELTAWNMNRYRGRRIGMTGSVRGNGEGFELSMPENVRVLLEPYKRRVI